MDHISNLCKTVLLCLTLSLSSNTASAEPFRMMQPLLCDDTKVVLSIVRDKHSEQLIWMGQVSKDIFQSLWVNMQTRSWSFIIVNKAEEKACLVSNGSNFSMMGFDTI